MHLVVHLLDRVNHYFGLLEKLWQHLLELVKHQLDLKLHKLFLQV